MARAFDLLLVASALLASAFAGTVRLEGVADNASPITYHPTTNIRLQPPISATNGGNVVPKGLCDTVESVSGVCCISTDRSTQDHIRVVDMGF
jgi:hypothetical protein